MWPHRNVPLGLLSNFLSTTAGSIGIARDAYVLLLPEGVGTATNVGLMEGMSGVVNLLTSFAAGIATDRCGRSPVLRLAAAACVLQASVMCLAVLSHSLFDYVELLGVDNGIVACSFWVLQVKPRCGEAVVLSLNGLM